KPFIGTVVRDVNVTVQTTGNTPATMADPGSVGDLNAFVTAPSGATSWLFSALTGQSLGPLSLDDQTPFALTNATTAPASTTLEPPYNGTAEPYCCLANGACPLAVLNGGSATGAWKLTVQDADNTPANITSRLDNWRLTVVAGRPFTSKPNKKKK